MTAALLARLATLHRETAAVLDALAREHATPQAPPVDEILRIREACERTAWRYSWAVKRWRKLGGFRDLDGALKIRASVLARHLADQAGEPR